MIATWVVMTFCGQGRINWDDTWWRILRSTADRGQSRVEPAFSKWITSSSCRTEISTRYVAGKTRVESLPLRPFLGGDLLSKVFAGCFYLCKFLTFLLGCPCNDLVLLPITQFAKLFGERSFLRTDRFLDFQFLGCDDILLCDVLLKFNRFHRRPALISALTRERAAFAAEKFWSSFSVSIGSKSCALSSPLTPFLPADVVKFAGARLCLASPLAVALILSVVAGTVIVAVYQASTSDRELIARSTLVTLPDPVQRLGWGRWKYDRRGSRAEVFCARLLWCRKCGRRGSVEVAGWWGCAYTHLSW